MMSWAMTLPLFLAPPTPRSRPLIVSDASPAEADEVVALLRLEAAGAEECMIFSGGDCPGDGVSLRSRGSPGETPASDSL